MQKIWLLLLDERFMTAFREGILVLCADNILRRLFTLLQRSFSYFQLFLPFEYLLLLLYEFVCLH